MREYPLESENPGDSFLEGGVVSDVLKGALHVDEGGLHVVDYEDGFFELSLLVDFGLFHFLFVELNDNQRGTMYSFILRVTAFRMPADTCLLEGPSSILLYSSSMVIMTLAILIF